MTVTAIGCTPGPAALAAVKKGLAAAGVTAEAVISGEFVATVRSLTGSSRYHVDRGAGIVGARTLNLPDGPVVVFNWESLSGVQPPDLERLAAHEAGHVLLYSRGEHVSDYQHLVTYESDWQLLCIGSYAAEEFRIESALPKMGYKPWVESPVAHMRDALAVLNYQVVSSVLGEPTVLEMRDTVLAAQDVFSKVLAYSAGAHVSGASLDLSALSGDAADEWADYVGDSWQARLKLWKSLPDAWQATTAEQWSAALQDALALEEQFMTRLGFNYRLLDEGLLFKRTGSNALFNKRLERAMRDFPR